MKFIHLLSALCFLSLGLLAEASPKIESWTDPSGTKVFLVENHGLPILDIQFSFAAGTSYSQKGKEGVASLTQSLLTMGAEDLDETQIANRLADLGAILSGGVDRDRATLRLRTLSEKEKRDPALELMRKVLTTPQFPSSVFEREKSRTIATLREAKTRPGPIASKAFWATMYPDHAYGRHATPESVASLSRADLVNFYKDYYSAKRASVAIVGNISRDEAKIVVSRILSGLPEGIGTEHEALAQLPEASLQRIPHPAAQAHVLIGLPALKRGDPDFFPLVVGNYTLGGGGFVSRLMSEVRDRHGFAYSVYSTFIPLKEMGPFQIGLQTKRSQVDDALRLTMEILNKFLTKGPTESELEAAKQNLAGSFPLRLDSNEKILNNVAIIGFYGLPLDYLEQYTANIKKVTAKEVMDAFARRVKPEHLVTVIVGSEEQE